MVWLVRILIFTILATTGVVPLPWGHSHRGMQQAELDRHREQFHWAEAADEMPRGWHWHFYGSQQSHDRAILRGNDRFAGMDLQFVEGSADLAISTFAESLDRGRCKLGATAQAVIGPKIYLQFLVLRN
ncbi:hypothetical protein [Bremerella sp. P1]|uniref:hypothetical protein n=1 Tax=Bremerella sp. P1 TaxID=3026424 RepID=UPI0023688308|nr:hypothetical protein [Bremerella sp. P1]WDI44003.1 hypothetical protein PSR63_08655 [Bremerella sp. P1]